jgi:hypothetical protein
MRDSLASGYKLAAMTLAVELLIAPFLVSDTFGIFAIIAMTLVGGVWLPAAVMIVSGVGARGSSSSATAYVVATVCGMLGAACAYTFARWTVLSVFVK